jgi:hypothetical protein
MSVHDVNGQQYEELCKERDEQLLSYRFLEREFVQRSVLKEASLFNRARIKEIAFGGATSYKKLEDHIELLGSLNRALETIRAVLNLKCGTH